MGPLGFIGGYERSGIHNIASHRELLSRQSISREPILGSLSICPGLAGPTGQLLNETHVRVLKTGSGQNGLAHGSELHSYLVLSLRSDKAQEFEEMWRKKCTRAHWNFSFKPARTSSFRPTCKPRLVDHLQINKVCVLCTVKANKHKNKEPKRNFICLLYRMQYQPCSVHVIVEFHVYN